MFAKFLLTVAVIAIIWFGFKYLQRIAELRNSREASPGRPPSVDKPPRFAPVDDGDSVHDLVKCPACGTFRSPKLGPCGQTRCPY